MTMGRPNKGSGHVDGLAGGQQAKDRLRAILQTLTGELTVEAACEQLGIQRAYFQELRQRALLAAAAAMEPQPPGRRPAVMQVEVAELEQLRADNDALRDELDAMMARVHLAMAMPQLLRPPGKGGHR